MQTINTDNIRTEFSTSADENIRSMKKQIRIEENFDILTREIIIGGKKAGFFFIDGFVQEDMIEKLMQFFSLRQDPCKAGLMPQAEQGICTQTLCS